MEPQGFLPDAAATDALGRALAATLRPGQIVRLEGDLGAGKSALARAIIRTFAADPELEVPSPTYALVQPYEFGQIRVLHTDLYRLGDPDELAELGLFDDPQALILVEWAERAPDLAAGADTTITLTIPSGGAGRHYRIAHSRRR